MGDLVLLRRYVAQENPNAAQRVAGKILDRVKLLSEHPMLVKPGRIATTRELVVAGTPYTIVYAPQSEGITILRVFHQAQQW
jgi:plasmid stabilization system protein ParE